MSGVSYDFIIFYLVMGESCIKRRFYIIIWGLVNVAPAKMVMIWGWNAGYVVSLYHTCTYNMYVYVYIYIYIWNIALHKK